MRRVFACLLALALGAACALLAACGGEGKGLIAAHDADAMQQQLDQIESSVRRGQCDGLAGELTTLQQQVNALPNRVDAALRRRLLEGAANLAQISPERCAIQAAKAQTTPTTIETTPTTPTATTPTTPTETTPTTPTQTTTTTVPPTTTQTPPTTVPPTTTGGSGGATAPDTGGTGGAGGTGGTGGTGGGVPTP